MNKTGHDSNFAFARRDNPGAIRSDQARGGSAQKSFYRDHVQDRNSFGNRNNHLDARINRLHNRIRSVRGRNEDQ